MLTLAEFLRDSVSSERAQNGSTAPSTLPGFEGASSSTNFDSHPDIATARWPGLSPTYRGSAYASMADRPYVPPPAGDGPLAPAARSSSLSSAEPTANLPAGMVETAEFSTLLAYLRRLAFLQDAMLRTVDTATQNLQAEPGSNNMDARTNAAMAAISNLNLGEREARLRATVDVLANELTSLRERRASPAVPGDTIRARRDSERLRARLQARQNDPGSALRELQGELDALNGEIDSLDTLATSFGERARERARAREARVEQRQRERDGMEAFRERARQLSQARLQLETLTADATTTAAGRSNSDRLSAAALAVFANTAARTNPPLDSLGNPDVDDPTARRGDMGRGVLVSPPTGTGQESGRMSDQRTPDRDNRERTRTNTIEAGGRPA